MSTYLLVPEQGRAQQPAALFAELKYRGVNCEYITEYAKDATWEKRGPKVFQAQEYIFGKQHFHLARVIEEVVPAHRRMELFVVDEEPVDCR